MRTFKDICDAGPVVIGARTQATSLVLQWLQQYTPVNLEIAGATPEQAMTLPLSREPVPMLLICPECGARHIDRGEFATKPHHTHACQHCGMCWRPAVVATVGVKFLPGFKDMEE